MPIHIDELDTQVDVQTSESNPEPPRTQPPAEALQRWQQLAARQAELQARTQAWGFDD
ncbi:MAG: hypothetical protein AB1430_13220 [Pseudomonadota bacterium]